jgi:glucosamine-6-phosphate deaminase
MNQPIQYFQIDRLHVNIFKDVPEMGHAAAEVVAQHIYTAIQERGSANMILATGTSQFSFLEALKQKKIDWKKISVFHLDEYIGISDQHPASFRKYLKDRILDYVKPGKTYFLNGDADDLDKEIEYYEGLLMDHQIDVACIGIGENGHIAFNDPPVADFDDPHLVKVVELDKACRMQQLGEGWFPTLDDVPAEALSLTIPAIMNSSMISCFVPDERKSTAVFNTLHGEISTACPASILRGHPNAVLFLDEASASKIKNLQ